MTEEVKIKITIVDTEALKQLDALNSKLSSLSSIAKSSIGNTGNGLDQLSKKVISVNKQYDEAGSNIEKITSTYNDAGEEIKRVTEQIKSSAKTTERYGSVNDVFFGNLKTHLKNWSIGQKQAQADAKELGAAIEKRYKSMFGNLNKDLRGYIKNWSIEQNKAKEDSKELGKSIEKRYKSMFGSIQGNLKTYDDFIRKSEELGFSSNKLADYMKAENLAFDKNGQVITTVTGEHRKYGDVLANMTKDSRRFKMEFLSILFTGMALDRVFGSLVRKQFELFGVTDLLGAAWTLVLLPIMELITPIIYQVLEAFMNLPDGLKLAIGGFVLLAAAIGKILTTVGIAVLGFQGLAKIFPTLATFGTKAVGAISKGFSTLATFMVPIIAIVWGIIDVINGWGKSTKDVVAGVIKILAGLAGIVALILGAPALLVAAIVTAVVLTVYIIQSKWTEIKEFFINTTKKMGEAFKEIWNGIKNFFVALWNGLKDFISNSVNAIRQKFVNGFTSIKEFFSNIWEQIKEIFRKSAEFIMSLPGKIIEAFKGLGKKIKDAVTDLLPDWMLKLFKKGTSWLRNGSEADVLGSFQTGGIIPETGPYLLHKGEEVVRRSEVGTNTTNFSPSITVNVNGGGKVSGDDIARRVSEQLNREWSYKFQRMTQR